jgi:hypothetical protein
MPEGQLAIYLIYSQNSSTHHLLTLCSLCFWKWICSNCDDVLALDHWQAEIFSHDAICSQPANHVRDLLFKLASMPNIRPKEAKEGVISEVFVPCGQVWIDACVATKHVLLLTKQCIMGHAN